MGLEERLLTHALSLLFGVSDAFYLLYLSFTKTPSEEMIPPSLARNGRKAPGFKENICNAKHKLLNILKLFFHLQDF